MPIACIETKEKDVIRERTHSRVLLAVGAALYLQGCGVTGAYPLAPENRIFLEASQRGLPDPGGGKPPRGACCALDAGEPAALSSRFPTSRSASSSRSSSGGTWLEGGPSPSSGPGLESGPRLPRPTMNPGRAGRSLEARVLVEKESWRPAIASGMPSRSTPENKSTRAELVAAYKHLGLQLYGKGDYRRASVYWTRASRSAPTTRRPRGSCGGRTG